MSILKLFTTRDRLIKQFTKDAEFCEQGKVDWDAHVIAFDNGNILTYQVIGEGVEGLKSDSSITDEYYGEQQ